MPFDLRTDPHRRFNPLTGEWVLVSPHRTARPWQGQVERPSPGAVPALDPACYMCPGNARASGQRNPDYRDTFVFDNDFPALRADTPNDRRAEHELLVASGEPGICRVVCFSPRHDLTLSRMPVADVRRVIDVWASEIDSIAALPGIRYVQVFENRGEMMGASNPHPHGQIWATCHLPNEVATEDAHLRRYYDAHGSDLLGDYLAIERQQPDRLVLDNQHFAAVVPFWAVWPFETIVIAKAAAADFTEVSPDARDDLARMLKALLTRYDNLFDAPCPYSMGFHLKPSSLGHAPHWRLHAHLFPPVLRSASVRKFMVGYEMLGTPQRDFTPEEAAQRLRALPETHYRERHRRAEAPPSN